MKNAKLFAPIALAILIGSLTFAFAQTAKNNFGGSKADGRNERRMPPGFPPSGGLNPQLLEQLNLTDAQKQQIQAIETSSRDASKENFDSVRSADEQLKTLVESGNFNEDAARQILNTKAQAMIEAEIVRLRTEAAILKILTTEQKAQLETLKQQRPAFPPRGGFRPEPQN